MPSSVKCFCRPLAPTQDAAIMRKYHAKQSGEQEWNAGVAIAPGTCLSGLVAGRVAQLCLSSSQKNSISRQCLNHIKLAVFHYRRSGAGLCCKGVATSSSGGCDL